MVKRGPKPKKVAPKKKRNYAAERRNAEARKHEDHALLLRQQRHEEWRQRYIQAINERLYSLPYEERPEYDPPEKLPAGSLYEYETTVTEEYRDEHDKLRKRKTKVMRQGVIKPPEPNHYDWRGGHAGFPPPLLDYLALLSAVKPETVEVLMSSPAYRRLVNEAGWYPRAMPGPLNAEDEEGVSD